MHMKTSFGICLLASILMLSAADAAADPIVFTTGVTTTGVFGCLKEPACTASGNTVTLGTGDSAVMLTFAGIDTTIDITNVAQKVSLGTLTATALGGATTFPSRTNPMIAILAFRLTIAHDTPADSDDLYMRFGPGGLPQLPFQEGSVYWQLALENPPGLNYGSVIYTLSPFIFSVPLNGSVDLTADVGAVPEPATMLLVGFGLLGAGAAARRRK